MSNNVFEVKNLKYKYPKNSNYTIKGINFEVKKGEIFGLLGPSGAGKSTTQKVLIGLHKNYEGTVKYNGKDLSKLDHSYYEEIGIGFELPVAYTKLTLRENINFYKSLYKNNENIEPLVKKLKLWDDMDKPIGEFSKGMKMRFNFIRALINKPKVLFLDESTNGLDPVNASVMKDIVVDFAKKGGTVFITTHLMQDVEEICDRAAFVVNGDIKEIAEVKELRRKYGKREVTVEVDGKETIFDMDTLGTNEDFIKLIKNGKVDAIHSGETSLDKIFIEVTGAKIDEE